MLAIIADDLTGANDVGIQFSEQGFAVDVFPHPPEAVGAARSQVAVVSTNSRALPAEAAAKAVRTVGQNLKDLGFLHFYKKIDSTLRGLWGVELETALDVLKLPAALIAPAFPAGGRTTVDGCQLVRGVPLADTEVRDDPVFPVQESYIPRLLSQQTTLKLGLLRREDLAGGAEVLAQRMGELMADGVRLLVSDAAHDGDLRRLVEAAGRLPQNLLYCGSAGLAQALAEQLAVKGADTGPEQPWPQLAKLVVVCGSRSPTARRQLDQALAALAGRELSLDPAVLEEGHLAVWAGELSQVIRESNLTVLSISPQGAVSLSGEELVGRLAAVLAEAWPLAPDEPEKNGLLLTGGDTALAVCQALGINRLRLGRELEKGIPLAWGSSDKVSYPIITKAGSFGRPESIAAIGQRLLR